MILEGIVTSLNEQQVTNVSPMGPVVDEGMQWLQLRPYQPSTTYQNLRRTRQGVFHVTDDVELIAQAAINRLDIPPETQPAHQVDGRILKGACRWYEFRVREIDDSAQRVIMDCEVVHCGHLRDFFGFNRAKHAVIEAAILATRLHLLPQDQVVDQLRALDVIVQKTAGPSEHRAFQCLQQFVTETTHSDATDS